MKKINNFLSIFFYCCSFIFARGTLFICPILIANLLPKESYGAIEWAYATGTFGAALLSFGTSSVIPLIILRAESKATLIGVYAHHVFLSLLSFFSLILSIFFFNDKSLDLALLMIGVFGLQVLWSTHLKVSEKNEASMLLDSALLIIITAGALIGNYFNNLISLELIEVLISVYAIILLFFTLLVFFRRLNLSEKYAYKPLLLIALPLMTSTIITSSVTTSGRMVVKYLGGNILTADYSILSRVAVLPIIAHQLIVVANFKKFFSLPDTEMKKIIFIIVCTISLSIGLLWISSPYVGWIFGPIFLEVFENNKQAFVWILSQSVLWSGIALHDMVNTRYQTMNKVLPASILYLIVFIPIFFFIVDTVKVSLLNFVILHGIFMLLFYLCQAVLMFKAGVRLLSIWIFSVFSYIGFIGLSYLLY